MDKPTTKAALLQNIKDEHKRLEKSFKGLSPTEMIKTSARDEWSIQDILAHVTAWENKFMEWFEAGNRGEKVVMPDWKQPGLLDEINADIYRRNRDRGLKEVVKEFKDSYKRILKTAKSIPEDILFTPGRMGWTGKNTLADYLASNSSEHYTEHVLMIETVKQKNGI